MWEISTLDPGCKNEYIFVVTYEAMTPQLGNSVDYVLVVIVVKEVDTHEVMTPHFNGSVVQVLAAKVFYGY